MKSNYKKNNLISINNDSYEVTLSIGMIVKNEEKVLKRCLDSLVPLMKALSCELIIVDTGSTDSTVEIAKQYTDKVLFFEWINDFAAARNVSLSNARGRWFMFIDADEYFDEDISELVGFFNMPELYNKYNSVEIMIRSYVNKEKTEYRESCLPRIFKVYDGIKFVGSVHEGIPIKYPLGYITTILHHTGYFYESFQQRAKKRDRNLSLMLEEYKKDPNNIRMISHIIAGLSKDVSEKELFVKKGLILAKENRKHLYANVLFIQAIEFYREENPEYALQICNEYFENDRDDLDNQVGTLDIWMLKSDICADLSKLNEAYEAFLKYSYFYERYLNEDLVMEDKSAYPIVGLTDSEYKAQCFKAALILRKLKKYDEALELLEKFDSSKLEGEDFRRYLGVIREVCQGKKDYKYMAKIYEEIKKTNDKNKEHLALYMLESTYNSFDTFEKRMNYARDIVESGCSGKYIELMELVLEQDKEYFENKLYDFMDSIDDWNDGYSEAIYLAVKNEVDISSIVERMDSSQFRAKIEEIAVNNDDFSKCVLNYGVPESYILSIKRFYWIFSLYEKASNRSFSLNDSERLKLYNTFISLLGDYVSNIYNPNLLNDDDIDVLPNLHKFGYYMKQANNALSKDDKILYIRNMKKALVNCESMKEIIQFLFEQFKKRL